MAKAFARLEKKKREWAGKKKEHKAFLFLGPETARWGGGLPREGVVAENFVPALETLSSLGFEERNPGCPGNFAGMSRTPGGVQKVCAKKLRAHFSFPKWKRKSRTLSGQNARLKIGHARVETRVLKTLTFFLFKRWCTAAS